MKKICIVTGTRAEYGLLRWVMQEIKDSKRLELKIIATGMHLSPEFGLTYKDIQSDGFKINSKVEMLMSSDTPLGITKSISLGVSGFGEVFNRMKPDLLLILGDRYEVLSAAIAATIARIPIAHLHGGELTEGLIDDPIRHSITKMSHFHFVATEEYKKRVIQLGENPKKVFNLGGLGIDNIKKLNLLNKKEFEKSINFKLGDKNLLVTFHPVTLEKNTSKHQINELLSALEALSGTKVIFTMPNADTEGRALFKLINSYVANDKNSCVFTSMGQLRYLSCMRYVDAVVGNSSSGLIEAPSFKIGTVNIGDRQRGRIKAKSVIDCKPKKSEIIKAINKIYTPSFKKMLHSIKNPYGSGGTSKRIVSILEKQSLNDLVKKKFYDIKT